jgi:hypothetical protein
MSIYSLNPNEKFVYSLTAYPEWNIFCTSFDLSASLATINGATTQISYGSELSGNISLRLEELNNVSGNIEPFIIRDSSLTSYRTISVGDYSSYLPGTKITGNYDHVVRITSSISIPGMVDSHLYALKNTLNYNEIFSKHYAFSSSFGDKSQQTIRIVQIPSLFYGKQIKRGSVELRVLRTENAGEGHTGTKSIAILKDSNLNGELIQSFDSSLVENSSSFDNQVAGTVLYKQGIILLSGSWSLTETPASGEFLDVPETTPRWYHFGEKTDDDSYMYFLKIKGHQDIPVRTFMLSAPFDDLDFSPNRTFISYGQSGSYGLNPFSALRKYESFEESSKLFVANTEKDIYSKEFVSLDNSEYVSKEKFNRQTFLSKIVLLDDNKLPLATVKLARPVRKRKQDEFLFKVSLDM